jgi:CheY-like chemotaxis protein
MAYKTRLDSVKSYLKIRMNIFVKKVEKINMRL